jgi:nifR3 family TIM-barrel protein
LLKFLSQYAPIDRVRGVEELVFRLSFQTELILSIVSRQQARAATALDLTGPFRGMNIRLYTPVFLAPMAGFTDAAMRRVCHQHGAGLTYTEMVNATGILRDSGKTWQLLETLPGEGPVVAHLYGSEPQVLADAAARVAATGRFVAIDLNAGCPMRKITTNGSGAALMKDPDRIAGIVAAMGSATDLPITVKTRIGRHPDRVLGMEILRAVEAAGGAAITFHGRFASQEHSGDVRLDLLAELKRASRIPVIGNGGIRTAADARQMFRETGVDAVMVARGALGNPWIFSDLSASLALAPSGPFSHIRKGEKPVFPNTIYLARCETPDAASSDCEKHPPKRDLRDIRAALEGHLADELELQRQIHAHFKMPKSALSPEQAAVSTFRCHLFRYLHGLKGSSYVRGQLNALRTIADIHAALDGCFEREARFRAHARCYGRTLEESEV